MDDFLDLARGLRSSGVELEEVLAVLRDRGASIVDSLKVVREVEQVTLGQAKALVDQSLTWADARSSNRELRESIIDALDGIDGEAPEPQEPQA